MGHKVLVQVAMEFDDRSVRMATEEYGLSLAENIENVIIGEGNHYQAERAIVTDIQGNEGDSSDE